VNRKISQALIAAATVSGLLFSGAVVGPAFAVPSYPSAAEVAAAKANVSAKKAMIKRLEDIIAAQAKIADAAGRVAQIKGETYNQAKDAVDVMTAKVNTLQAQADAANAAAEEAQTQLGRIAAQMYRDGTGGTALQMFLNQSDAADLLYKLGAQDKVAAQSDEIYRRSIAKQNYAQSVSDQLAVAKGELAVRATAAQAAYNEAQTAANEVQAIVDESNRKNAVAYTQLAELRNTAADLERQRAEGLAAEARQNAGTSKPIAPELYSVADANPNVVAAAIEFGKSQLGERYVLGGMGPDVWDCSGLTKASYAAAGLYIGTHSATNQFRQMAADRKLVPLTQWQAGDLIWYSQESAFDGDKYHVAIYLGDNMMLEAPNPARTVRVVPVRFGELFPYAGRPSA
jgi:cell wall-associated NlpC family hydrolase